MKSRDVKDQKLYEIVDHVIDNCCELGDASVTIEDAIGTVLSSPGLAFLY